MDTIAIKDEFIKLGQALKLAGLCESGVEAKICRTGGTGAGQWCNRDPARKETSSGRYFYLRRTDSNGSGKKCKAGAEW